MVVPILSDNRDGGSGNVNSQKIFVVYDGCAKLKWWQ